MQKLQLTIDKLKDANQQPGSRPAGEQEVQQHTAELERSRDLLQATLDTSMDMIQVFDAVRNEAGEIIDFTWVLNNHTSQLKHGDLRGQSLLERNPGVIPEPTFDAFKHVVSTGEAQQVERHYQHGQFDGWFLQSIVKLGDGVATTTKEITDWKHAQSELLQLRDEIAQVRLHEREQALRASEQHLQLAMEAAGMYSWNLDTATGKVSFSDNLNEIAGFTADTLASNVGAYINLLAFPPARERHQAALQKVGPGGTEFHELICIPNPDTGEMVALETHGAQVPSPGGKPLQIVGVGINVTERRRAEIALRASEERHTFLLNLSDALCPLDDPHEILLEAARVLGEHLGTDHAYYVDIDEEHDEFVVARDWHRPGETSHARRYPLSEWTMPWMTDGQTWVVADVDIDPVLPDQQRQWYRDNGVRAAIVVPLIKHGRMVATFVTNQRQPRSWTPSEVALIEDTAERIWATVERAKAKAALHISSERMRKIVTQAATGVVQTDEQGCITLVNQKFCSMLAYTETDLLGRNIVDLVAPEYTASMMSAIADIAEGGPDFVLEKRYQRKDGSQMWANCSINSVRDPDGTIQGLVAIVIDISDRKHAEERARHASLHDPLTGLPNRAMLFEYASHILSHNKRHHRCAALLFIDLDRFKPINDTHGHAIGDYVLHEVARRLGAGLRSEDIVARLGGDEFVVLLQDVREFKYASDIARHILERISQPYGIGALALTLSASIGISIFPRDGDTIDMLVSHADMAMYQAKQNGRDNYQFFCPEYAAIVQAQLSIEHQLRSAINDEAFHIFYQPIIDIHTGRVVSAEALLRWQHSDIGPERFVPIAEATGMINPIGRWVSRQVSRQYRAWQAAGLPPIPISVNVSVVEFRDRDFASRLRAVLHDECVDPAALQLEVTETAVMENVDHAIAILSELKELGIKILLDDFGTGHSSLAYVARLPLDKLKIDRSFISHEACNDAASRAVTYAMIALGRALKLDVVAEGVECEEALAFIQSLGCNQAQGFHLGRPMPGDMFVQWYRQRTLE